MQINHGNGPSNIALSLSIELSGEEVARAIDAWLVGQGVVVSGPRTVTVNGQPCEEGHVSVDPSGFIIAEGRKVYGSSPAAEGQGEECRLYARYFDFIEEDWSYVPKSRADLSRLGVPRGEQVLSFLPLEIPGKYALRSHGVNAREYTGLGAYKFDSAHSEVTLHEKRANAPRLIVPRTGHIKVAPHVTLKVELPLHQMQTWAKHIGHASVSDLEKELEYHFTKSEHDEAVWNCQMVHPASGTAMNVRPQPGEELTHGTHGVA